MPTRLPHSQQAHSAEHFVCRHARTTEHVSLVLTIRFLQSGWTFEGPIRYRFAPFDSCPPFFSWTSFEDEPLGWTTVSPLLECFNDLTALRSDQVHPPSLCPPPSATLVEALPATWSPSPQAAHKQESKTSHPHYYVLELLGLTNLFRKVRTPHLPILFRAPNWERL